MLYWNLLTPSYWDELTIDQWDTLLIDPVNNDVATFSLYIDQNISIIGYIYKVCSFTNYIDKVKEFSLER